MSYVNTACTVTLQRIVNILKTNPLLRPIVDVVGSEDEPALSAANDVMDAICGVPFPHKWNEMEIPVFYTNSYQQDYAGIYPNGASITNLSWLERGVVIDINNTAQPKPYCPVEVGRQLPQATANWFNTTTPNFQFRVNYFPNNNLYYGTWGAAQTGNSTFGNNPLAGSVYTNPLGNISQPANPITQIQDANGNYLVLTGYGTEGSTAPLAPANSGAGVTATPGSGATTVWTVVDPYGQGFRIFPVPNQTGVVWEFNLVGQMLPIRFTQLNTLLAPLPDQFETNFRMGMTAQLYRYSPSEKVRATAEREWMRWLASLTELRAKQDREKEENRFTVRRGIMSRGGGNGGNWWGPAWPFSGGGPGQGI